MRRTLGSIGAWLVATSIAILVAWLGVRSVQFAAVPDHIEPLSAAEARRLAPHVTAVSPIPSQSASPTAEPSPSHSPKPKPKPRPKASAAPVDEGWRQISDGKGGFALQRTFVVKGGAATIRFAEGDVRITATAPADGFGVSFDQRGPDVAIVTFTSPKHFSRLEASWESGAKVKSIEGDA